MRKNNLKYGDKVTFSYMHYFNAPVGTPKMKIGEFRGLIKHTVKHWSKLGSVQMACVKFNGNKSISKVPLNRLTKVE